MAFLDLESNFSDIQSFLSYGQDRFLVSVQMKIIQNRSNADFNM